MWDDECINFVLQSLRTEEHRALRDSSELRDLHATVEELCAEGEDLHNRGAIPDKAIRRKKEYLFRQYPIEAQSDPAKLIALLFFQIGLAERRTTLAKQSSQTSIPTPLDPESPGKEKTDIRILPDGAVRSALPRPWGGSDHTSNVVVLPTASGAVNEEYLSTELAKAQRARWQCRYDEVRRIVARLHSNLSSVNSIKASFWKAKLLDLQVETTFTISQRPQFSLALEQAERAIKRWVGLHDPVMLTHAYLRQSVIYRQMFTESQSQGLQVDRHIHDSLLSLYQAEEETLHRLARLNTLDARNTTFALYNDLAKTLSHARQFGRAKYYLREAQAHCAELGELAPRRLLDLSISRSLFIREGFFERHIYGPVGQLEDLLTSIEEGLTYPLDFADVVLREMLLKSSIPLLVSMGRQEEAEEVFRQCRRQARQMRLHNQQRDLSYLTRVLKLRSI